MPGGRLLNFPSSSGRRGCALAVTGDTLTRSHRCQTPDMRIPLHNWVFRMILTSGINLRPNQVRIFCVLCVFHALIVKLFLFVPLSSFSLKCP